MTVVLRDADADDQARCVELLSELSSATGSTHSVNLQNAFASLLNKTRGQIVIAEESGSILGMATISYNVALRYGGEYCQLEELIVTPEARGKKLGGLLIQKIIENARERGCAEIGLYLVSTTEHNRAFYEKYGFEVVGNEMRMSISA